MHAAHHLVSLEQATPGMVLSDAILDKQGKVLLAEGTVLTASTITGLRRHEVAMVPVAVAGEATPPIDEAAVTARLAFLFRGVSDTHDESSAAALLQAYVTDYRLGREVAA